MEQTKEKNSTELILKNRAELNISGVCDIISSDEISIFLDTAEGALEIGGSELHIISMNVASGAMLIEGRIDTISYHDKQEQKKSGFLARMFR